MNICASCDYSPGPDCGFPDWYKIVMMGYMTSMLVLFMDFYLKSYTKPKGKI